VYVAHISKGVDIFYLKNYTHLNETNSEEIQLSDVFTI